MKKIVFVFAIFVIVTSGYAQVNEKSERQFYKQGDWEFGFSVNIGKSSNHTIETNSYYNSFDSSHSSYTYDNTEKGIYIPLGVSIGYYIVNGLSFEPEFDLNLSSSEGVSVSLLGILCYTFYLPQKSIYPYVKIGYGLSDNPVNSESLEFNTINASAGIKLTYRSGMAFRIEINYRNINGSNTDSYSDQSYSSSNTSETTLAVISISFGASVLF